MSLAKTIPERMFGNDDRNCAGVVDPHRLVASLPNMAPGRVAAVLADVDRRVLTGAELVVLVGAECRVQSWIQAGLAESMDELAHCPDAPTLQADDGPAVRVAQVSRFTADEVALAASGCRRGRRTGSCIGPGSSGGGCRWCGRRGGPAS